MSFEMNLETHFSLKTLVALGTRMIPNPSMNSSLMILQRVGESKELTTLTTLMPVSSTVCVQMTELMFIQSNSLMEGFRTFWTLVLPDLGVNSHVNLQAMIRLKLFPALLT
jgi:hypothetical protein